MTKEELEAIAEAAKSGTDVELNAKLEAIVKAVNATSKNADAEAKAKADAELAAKQKEAQALLDKTKKEADIKNMLTDNSNKKIDYSELEPEDILNIVADAFDTSIDARTKLSMAEIAQPIEKLNADIADIKKYLIQSEAQKGVERARDKYGDFDDHKEEMDKVWERYPGISVDDCYVLAKGNKAKDVIPRGVSDSEKPISLATRKANSEAEYAKQEKKGGLGHRGFKALLEKKAAQVISRRN